jgi:hypothetical protein
MSQSYRIRTEVGKDKYVNVLLEQDFEHLEILSLKILQSQIYTRLCSDYGVVAGRITANSGLGLPNCKVSIFIPLSNQDENNPIISDLYPYKLLNDTNVDGYRYNLLPYVRSHSGHNPTGSFPDRIDVLTDPNLIEVYDKYYKFTVKTNDSGDFLIFGVPLGTQTIHVDIDLSDIGEFSLSPQDLIRLGVATESQVAGTEFRTSTDLNTLPQIVSFNRTINIEPLWGQPEVCTIGITRTDFDITEEAGIEITPTAIFMGSLISTNDDHFLKKGCRVKPKTGSLCNLVTSPGEILAIRQTIGNDDAGRPILESYDLDTGGQVIDENGAWLIDVPMNLDYITTNEFGERVISNDPKVGVPTKAKYRFKVKWNQEPTLNASIKRGYFLVPNVREYGWDDTTPNRDPLVSPFATQTNRELAIKSYAFSLNWDDYAEPQVAINCEDSFYLMTFNKVYTISQLIDQYRNGFSTNRIISIKEISDDSCESENYKFPTNDSSYRPDIVFLLFSIMMFIFRPILIALVPVVHFLFLITIVLRTLLLPFLSGLLIFIATGYFIEAVGSFASFAFALGVAQLGLGIAALALAGGLIFITVKLWQVKLNGIYLPLLTYPDCDLCKCDLPPTIDDKESGISDGYDTTFPGQNNPAVSLEPPSGLQLTPFSSGAYNLNQSTTEQIPAINQILAGGTQTNPVSSTMRAPQLQVPPQNSNYSYSLFSTSLTIAERINLFNTKAKYFNESPFNPGGSVNRIKVKVEPTLNTLPTNIHYDNIVAIVCTPDSLQYLTSGKILTFQNPEQSRDKNYTGATTNIYNNNAIIGSTAYTGSITINYANPNGSGNVPITYQIPAPTADTSYHKFPVDMEYFQVLTAMTFSNYTSQSSTFLPHSFNTRFIDNTTIINQVEDTNCVNTIWTRNPMREYQDFEEQIVVFLVRGIDPYSSRYDIEYDLSYLFGYNTYGQKVIRGSYKLNIPIQGSFRNIPHNIGISDTAFNSTTLGVNQNIYLYHDTFSYVPSPIQFSSFTTDLNTYYSKLDGSNSTYSPGCNPNLNLVFGTATNPTYGLRVSNSNKFTIEYDNQQTAFFPSCTYYEPTNNTISPINTNSRGYFLNEIVEGGSVLIMNGNVYYPPNDTNYSITSVNLSPKYLPTETLTINSGSSGRKLVMRSDRLPTSTNETINCNNSFSLQNNPNFSFYFVSDDGTLSSLSSNVDGSTGTGFNNSLDNSGSTNFTNTLLESLSCENAVPLACYETDSNGNLVVTHGKCEKVLGQKIFKNGCYRLVSIVLISLPTDIGYVYEWSSRLVINFAACRNVWSNLFTNNWVNGTLFAYSFRNNRVFDSQNRPTSEYCKDLIYLHPTNNFYYRSSPYVTGTTNGFIAAPPGGIQIGNITITRGIFGGNERLLKSPTTMLDLGPRTNYIQELVYSDEYDGYVMKNLNSTSYNDVSEILNLLIISRLANTSFLAILTSTGGANIFSYFSRRNTMADADYAQMISISSELGVAPFEAENYPDNPGGQNPIYYDGSNAANGVFGIFFSSDTQVRDYISPKRTIISPTAPPNSVCAFNNFSVYSQEVPFYQWQINSADSIFGTQKNEWYTDPISSDFYFSNNFQSMDRLSPTSRYFRTTNLSQSDFNKGYIYAVNNNTPADISPSPTFWSRNTAPLNTITTGAPLYFYFGLKRGKSSWDRFAKKWINLENITG